MIEATHGQTAGPPDEGPAVLGWAEWTTSAPYTIGIEEEVMLVDPRRMALISRGEEVIVAAAGTDGLADHLSGETHAAALELATAPHAAVADTLHDASDLRRALAGVLAEHNLAAAAAAGTHPTAQWMDVTVSRSARYTVIENSMRALARREPTFAMHVHVGVPDPEAAIRLLNRLRGHLPLLLALSANSPFWQGRDTGMASMRTPLFGAFPRVGIPRAFTSYADWCGVVDTLLRSGAVPEPTFLWWDIRPQPRFGTIEVRVMDAQSTVGHSGLLAALVQALARLELEEGYLPAAVLDAGEVLAENRFLAARDGMDAEFIDVHAGRRVPATAQLTALLAAVAPHAQDLGCAWALEPLRGFALDTGPGRQRRIAGQSGLDGLVERLARHFLDSPPFTQ